MGLCGLRIEMRKTEGMMNPGFAIKTAKGLSGCRE